MWVLEPWRLMTPGSPAQEGGISLNLLRRKGTFFITLTSHGCHGISNHCQLDFLFNSLFKLTTNKTLKLCIIGLLWRETTCALLTIWASNLPVDSPLKRPVIQCFHVIATWNLECANTFSQIVILQDTKIQVNLFSWITIYLMFPTVQQSPLMTWSTVTQ